MIRTLVVDDEPYLRNSIKKTIESMNSCFEVIAMAGNGRQALSIVLEQHPDVVFLDIRMPIMDGLAFLEKISAYPNKPLCIILTGYSEFEYAKKALKYHVYDYILKPIHLEQMQALLNSIQSDLSTENEKLENAYFHHMFKGMRLPVSFSAQDPAKIFSEYSGFNLYYMIAGSYMYIKNNQFNPTGQDWSIEQFCNNFNCFLPPHAKAWFISGENSNELLIIVGYHTLASPDAPNKIAAKLYDCYKGQEIPFTLCFNPTILNISQIRNSAIDLKYYSTQKIIFGYSSLHCLRTDFADKQQAELVMDYQDLKNIISEKRYQDFKINISVFLKYFETKKIYQYQLRTELVKLLQILHQTYFSEEQQHFVEDIITNTYSYTELTQLFMQNINEYSDNYYQELTENIAENIKKYIDEHYMEQLTLKQVAEHFFISQSTLSRSFKKLYKISPNEYIMEKRIAKSKDLLQVFPPLNIKQIAAMVGYTDPFYFSRIFKIVTGTSPTAFREL